MKKFIQVFIAALILNAGKTSAARIIVSSVTELQTAVGNAMPGDTIIVTKGIYTTTANITINRSGTVTQPILIASQGVGGAEITGAGGFNLVSPASHIIIKGFKFTHASSRARISKGTSFCRFTQNIFETPGKGEDLTVAGRDQQVDYNTFQNKNAMGRFLAIRGSGSQIAQRLWIHHNYFKSYKDQGGANGAEAFQFGGSEFSMSSSNSIVENNIFEDCAGETELISVKASEVTLRFNTFRNNPAQFTLRHGNRCQVYGNYFFNTPGIRIFGDNHVIYSNYFENCSRAIQIGNGDGEVADGASLSCHDRPDHVLIAFNTLINNKSNIVLLPLTDGMGATYINIANNIIQGGTKAVGIAGPYTGAEWAGNIIYQVTEAGDIPATGYSTLNPLLAKDNSGTFHLTAGSPAIDSSIGSYPIVAIDMDGQLRKGMWDIGADEVSTVKASVGIDAPPPIVGATSIKYSIDK